MVLTQVNIFFWWHVRKGAKAMSNGNDWQQPGEQQQSPVRTYSNGATGPEPSGMGLLTEGWGAGESISFGEISDRFKLVWQRTRGSVLKAWIAMSLIGLAFGLLSAITQILIYFVPAAGVAAAVVITIVAFLAIPLLLLIGIVQVAMLRPLHQLIFDNSQDSLGIMGAIRESLSAVPMLALVTIIIVLGFVLGGVCCVVPGLVIGFMLCQSPYLVAARGMGLSEALKESIRLNKAYWQVVLGLLGACIALAVVNAVIGGVIRFGASFIYPFDQLVLSLVGWVTGLVFTVGMSVMMVSVYSLIESRETGRTPVA